MLEYIDWKTYFPVNKYTPTYRLHHRKLFKECIRNLTSVCAMTAYTMVRVRRATHKKLTEVLGILTNRFGRKLTYTDAIEILCDTFLKEYGGKGEGNN